MTVSPTQLGQLKQFVEGQPSAAGWKFVQQSGSTHASRHIRITDEFGWTLMLFPGTGDAWRAYCAHEAESNYIGTLTESLEWLARKGRDAERLQQGARDLWTFAGRPSWRYVEKNRRGNPYVRRVFEFPEAPEAERVCLFLTMTGDRRKPFTGQVQLAFGAGPEDSITGELGEVSEWLTGWEKTLLIPAKIRDCSDREEAEEVTKRAALPDVFRLAYLFGFGNPLLSSGPARQKLVEAFGPAEARSSR